MTKGAAAAAVNEREAAALVMLTAVAAEAAAAGRALNGAAVARRPLSEAEKPAAATTANPAAACTADGAGGAPAAGTAGSARSLDLRGARLDAAPIGGGGSKSQQLCSAAQKSVATAADGCLPESPQPKAAASEPAQKPCAGAAAKTPPKPVKKPAVKGGAASAVAEAAAHVVPTSAAAGAAASGHAPAGAANEVARWLLSGAEKPPAARMANPAAAFTADGADVTPATGTASSGRSLDLRGPEPVKEPAVKGGAATAAAGATAAGAGPPQLLTAAAAGAAASDHARTGATDVITRRFLSDAEKLVAATTALHAAAATMNGAVGAPAIAAAGSGHTLSLVEARREAEEPAPSLVRPNTGDSVAGVGAEAAVSTGAGLETELRRLLLEAGALAERLSAERSAAAAAAAAKIDSLRSSLAESRLEGVKERLALKDQLAKAQAELGDSKDELSRRSSFYVDLPDFL